jgi:hypothetical protein
LSGAFVISSRNGTSDLGSHCPCNDLAEYETADATADCSSDIGMSQTVAQDNTKTTTDS